MGAVIARTQTLALAHIILIASTIWIAANPWDDPAITVFPSHEGIVSGEISLEQAIRDGKALFRTRFNTADGAGRPMATGDSKPTPRSARVTNPLQRIAGPDASACSSCHNQPVVGGSGDSVTNVFVGAQFSDPPVTNILPRETNERNTVTLFGSGLIEGVSAEMTAELHEQRTGALTKARQTGTSVRQELGTKGVTFGYIVAHPDGYIDYHGIEGVDYDLIVKPFGIKGILISLREFTVGALNHHHGIQPVERFGWERTGSRDFDEDGIVDEFSIGQVTALTLFQAALPPPRQLWSRESAALEQERKGEALFSTIGCSACHLPELVLRDPTFREPNKYNRPGALTPDYSPGVIELNLAQFLQKNKKGEFVVRAFTDLKRHRMCDDEIKKLCNEERKQDNVAVNLFVTQKLWDLATSAPYCHRGDCTTLGEAILAHGGEGRSSREAFLKLSLNDKRALIAYLKTLGKAEDTDSGP